MAEKSAKEVSLQQEKDIAELLGGKVQLNSGGTKFGGGDVHTKKFLIEAKAPTKPQSSFSIKWEWWKKALEQSWEQNKDYCALAFRFAPQGEDYFIISSARMKQLVRYLEETET